MRELDLHCKIDENVFSWAMFFSRLLVSVILLYVVGGCLLYYRDFLYNVAALGWPLPIPLGLSLLAGQVLLALFFLLGWFTRLVAGLNVLTFTAVGVIFFAADINRIFIALVLFLIVAVLPVVLLGPGKISLDYKHALYRAARNFRG